MVVVFVEMNEGEKRVRRSVLRGETVGLCA